MVAKEILDEIIKQSGWPAALFKQSHVQPTVVETTDEFLDELLLGNHMDDVVVLKDGLKKLDLEGGMPPDFLEAVKASGTVRDFLGKIDPQQLNDLKGRVYFSKAGTWKLGQEKELRKNDDGDPLETLLEKHLELQKRPDLQDRHMYLTEMRYTKKYRHERSGEWVKTLLKLDVKDCLSPRQVDCMPYWDRYDEGAFIGGKDSGSPLHVDQVSWSNVGKNYCGYKVMAIWKYGPESFDFLETHLRQLFVDGCPADQIATLKDACKLVVVSPGDVFIFSGANPHVVMSTGEDLSLTAYESFCNLNPRHVEVLLETATANHFKECWPEEETIQDIKEEVSDAFEEMQHMADHGIAPLQRDTVYSKAHAASAAKVYQDDFMSSYLHAKKRSRSDPAAMSARKAAQDAFTTALAACTETADYEALKASITQGQKTSSSSNSSN